MTNGAWNMGADNDEGMRELIARLRLLVDELEKIANDPRVSHTAEMREFQKAVAEIRRKNPGEILARRLARGH